MKLWMKGVSEKKGLKKINQSLWFKDNSEWEVLEIFTFLETK